MKTEEIKINETHICILKGSATQIYVELYPLVFEFEKEFSQLETIASNQNRKSYELFDYVINGPLKCLMKRFDFCEDLELPYQGIYPLITEDFIDYNEEFANFMSELRRSHESELNKILAGQETPTLIVRAEEGVPIEDAVFVMDIANKNNYKVVLAVRPN